MNDAIPSLKPLDLEQPSPEGFDRACDTIWRKPNENTKLDKLQRRLHDSHESSAMLREKIESLESENTKLKRELRHLEDGYKKLAAHHNRKCTCMETY